MVEICRDVGVCLLCSDDGRAERRRGVAHGVEPSVRCCGARWVVSERALPLQVPLLAHSSAGTIKYTLAPLHAVIRSQAIVLICWVAGKALCQHTEGGGALPHITGRGLYDPRGELRIASPLCDMADIFIYRENLRYRRVAPVDKHCPLRIFAFPKNGAKMQRRLARASASHGTQPSARCTSLPTSVKSVRSVHQLSFDY